jgi:hypothetical protein
MDSPLSLNPKRQLCNVQSLICLLLNQCFNAKANSTHKESIGMASLNDLGMFRINKHAAFE